ncbi:uncharacterized protein RHOBADRAFT_53991 [Rhodotorula graminis WP1]|uniref:Uncharacterized protein n=1 Tax=Rhodotorula graminis (strain WP1) TaxID=578459 RepID=A0A194S0J4_RHOGW|nr:uncharacterized protein RHOBADRAFT_53991 [Rhodotorula graminis WP1]KPV74127.1 hypothetical protein RHOBADRAFT_53991 [Rhodotorula graminis WP1]
MILLSLPQIQKPLRESAASPRRSSPRCSSSSPTSSPSAPSPAMSSGSITINYTTLAEIALVGALIGGICYAGSKGQAALPVDASSASHALDDAHSALHNKAKKANKKKKGALAQAQDAAAPLVDQAVSAASSAVNTVKQQPVVHKAAQAAQAAQGAAAQASNAAHTAAKAVQGAAASAGASVGASSAAPAPPAGSSKKGKKKGGNKAASSAAAAAAAGAEHKPDAEVHAEQKHPAPSGPTADMRDSDDDAVHVARVLKVVGGKAGADPNSLQVPKADEAWERSDSFDDDDGEWEAVPSKKVSRPSTPSGAALSSAPARSIPGLPTSTAGQPLTKKQRENAAKKSKEQSAREAKEAEQEARLAQYRREQDKAKLAESQAARVRARPRSQNFFGSEPQAPAAKVVGGGMSAALDPSSGSLIWD